MFSHAEAKKFSLRELQDVYQAVLEWNLTGEISEKNAIKDWL